MRWTYANPNLPADRSRLAALDRAIAAWWTAFERHAGDLDAAFSKRGTFDVAGFMHANLHPVHEELGSWEFGAGKDRNGHRLMISAEGKPETHQVIRRVLARAPRLPGWEFYPYRMPDPPDMVPAVVAARTKYDITGTTFQARLGDHNRVDVVYLMPNLSKDDRAAKHAAFVATEYLVGEEMLDHWIGVVEIAPTPKRGWFGLRSAQQGLPLDRLRSTVDALTNQVCEQLSPEPWWAIDVRTESHPWASYGINSDQRSSLEDLELESPGRADIIAGITAFSAMASAAMTAGRFSSRRFSRCDETFAYLKLDGREGLDAFADRGELEEAIDAVLVPARLGRTIGGATGRVYSYVDLALTDVVKALPVLKQFAIEHRLPRSSWLLFFDTDLSSEWVGLVDDSNPPPGLD